MSHLGLWFGLSSSGGHLRVILVTFMLFFCCRVRGSTSWICHPWISSFFLGGGGAAVDCHHRIILFTNLQDADTVFSLVITIPCLPTCKLSLPYVVCYCSCFQLSSSEATRLHLLTFVVVVNSVCSS